MNRKPLGKPIKADLDRSCVLCTKWQGCRDPAKSFDYACSRFKPNSDLNLFEIFEKEDAEVATTTKRSNSEFPLANSRAFNTDLQVFDPEDDEDSLGELSKIVKSVLNSGVPVPPDIRLKDDGIFKPKNVVEWITDPQCVGSEEPPFGKQIQVLSHLFAEWCPNCSDEDYFEDVPVEDRLDDILEHVVFLENGRCPSCKMNKGDLVAEEILNDPDEMVGVVGQRGSKSITGTLAESYNFARWLICPNIPATFQILPSSVLRMTYTATTFNQAKSSFWDPLNNLLTSAPWFKEYHKFLDEIGREYGEELYKHSETLIAYRHKNIFASPASPSQRSLRGRTSISAVIDEAGWFKTGQKKSGGDFEMMNGQEVYIALKRSFRTMSSGYNRSFKKGFFNIPKPIMIMISSPSARNDLIMSRYRESFGSRKVYAFKYPTWEFNPLISREDLDEEFRTKPMECARDYGCEPPMAMGAWINDEKLILPSFSGKKNAFNLIRKRVRTKSKKLATSASLKMLKKSKSPYGGVLGIDASSNNNSFAFSVAYPTSIPDIEDEENEEILVPIEIIAVGEVIPTKKYPISFTKLYKDVIKPICEIYNIAVVVSDGWQSRKIVQDLEDSLGLDYFDIRLNMENFNDYKEALYDELISHPKLEMEVESIVETTMDNYPECFLNKPCSHLFYQFMTVRNTGNSVVKGDDGATDDILRACVIAHTALQDEEILEICEDFNIPYDESITKPAIAAISSSGGAGYSRAGSSNVGVKASMGSKSGGNTSLGVVSRRK
jgi:hypothetical protein